MSHNSFIDAIACTIVIFGHNLPYSRKFKVSERLLPKFKARRDDEPGHSEYVFPRSTTQILYYLSALSRKEMTSWGWDCFSA